MKPKSVIFQKKRTRCQRSLHWLEKFFDIGRLLSNLVSDEFCRFLKFGLIRARLVRENDTSRADCFPCLVLQHELNLKMVSSRVNLKIWLARVDHAEIIFVGFLANASDIRC